jgi:hypothetical protein
LRWFFGAALGRELAALLNWSLCWKANVAAVVSVLLPRVHRDKVADVDCIASFKTGGGWSANGGGGIHGLVAAAVRARPRPGRRYCM